MNIICRSNVVMEHTYLRFVPRRQGWLGKAVMAAGLASGD